MDAQRKGEVMPLYKMSDLAPLAMAEINAIIRLASEKEKLALSADRETITVKGKRARRGKQLELQLQQSIRRN
jgi:hypothetical protein